MSFDDYFFLKSGFLQDFFNSSSDFPSLIKGLDGLIENLFQNPPKGFSKQGNLLLGTGVEIDSNVTILGKAVIMDGTKIHDNSLLREGVVIGKECEIGHASEIKHSIILNNSNAAHFNYVGDSVIGNKVNLAAGVILANFKNAIDKEEINITLSGKKFPTGLRKFGAIIGDGVKIGCNSVTDPGTVIGKETYIYPLSYIKGEIPARKIVKNRPNLEIVDKQ